jgi:hypothetical protein
VQVLHDTDYVANIVAAAVDQVLCARCCIMYEHP